MDWKRHVGRQKWMMTGIGNVERDARKPKERREKKRRHKMKERSILLIPVRNFAVTHNTKSYLLSGIVRAIWLVCPKRHKTAKQLVSTVGSDVLIILI